MVSSDVKVLKEEFSRLDTALSGKIENETRSLIERINETSESFARKLENLIEIPRAVKAWHEEHD